MSMQAPDRYPQPGILQNLPPLARYLSFSVGDAGMASLALRQLADLVDGTSVVVGVGLDTVLALNGHIPGLRHFPQLVSTVNVPIHPVAVWCWLRGDDQGRLLHLGLQVQQALSPAFVLDSVVDAFTHAGGRDLSGYEDGTENPAQPQPVAIVSNQVDGLDGGSLVAVQQWQHDFGTLARMPQVEKDNAVGRRQSDNEELDDAPESAHVKRTAQESFEPEAFIWRRSMPWASGQQGGLMFVAFGHSLDPFEAQMRRMVGLEDGVVDALFSFSKPLNGAYLWCPPMQAGKLNLSALGL